MNTWIALVFERLVDIYLLSAVLLAATLIATRWLIRHPGQRMAWSWGTTAALFALVGAALLPTGWRLTPAGWLARAHWNAPPVVVHTELSAAPVVNDVPEATRLSPAARPPITESPALIPPPQTRLSWQAAQVSLVTAWGSAAAVIAVWLLVGAFRARGLRRGGQPAPDWAGDELRAFAPRKTPPLLASQSVPTAVALGALHPAILLPAKDIREDNQPAVRAAIRHEWAHIAGGDLWLHAAQRWLMVVLFAHPLYWLFRRQTRFDQELLADAAAAGSDPLAYAEVLLGWARQAASGGPVPSSSRSLLAADACGLAMWREASSLQRRIEMLVQRKSFPLERAGRFWQGLALALVVTFGLALSAVTLQSQDRQEADDSPVTDLAVNQHGTGARTILGQDQGGKRLVVISEANGRLVVNVQESVLGPDVESSYVLNNAAELAKRHPEVFQLYQKFVAAAEQRAALKATANIEVAATPTKARRSAIDGEIFLVETTIGEVSHLALSDSDDALGDIFQEELDGACQLKGNLIFALCKPEQAARIAKRLNKAQGLHILSRPSVATQDNVVAQVHIGSEIPVLKTISIQNGKPQEEVTYVFEGIRLELTPHRVKRKDSKEGDPEEFSLELSAEVARRQPQKDPNSPPELDRRAVKLKTVFEPAQVLLVAERKPKESKSKQATLFLQLKLQIAAPGELPGVHPQPQPTQSAPANPATVQELPRTPPPTADSTESLKSLQAENEQLKREVRALQIRQEEMLKRLTIDLVTPPEPPKTPPTNQPVAAKESQPIEAPPAKQDQELQKQLRDLDLMEAEAVVIVQRQRFQDAQKMFAAGVTSKQELTAAQRDASIAEIEVQRRRNADDPRAQAAALWRIAEANLAAAKHDYEYATELQKTQANSISATEVANLALAFRRAEIAVRRAQLQYEAARQGSGSK